MRLGIKVTQGIGIIRSDLSECRIKFIVQLGYIDVDVFGGRQLRAHEENCSNSHGD